MSAQAAIIDDDALAAPKNYTALVGASSEIVITYEDLPSIADGPYWIQEFLSEGEDDSESASEDGDAEDNPDWFNHCCVLDVKVFTVPYALIMRASLLWQPGQDIKYAFLGGTPNQQETVRKGMNEWMRYANIRFVQLPPDRVTQSHIRIAFKPKDGNWSRLGQTALEMLKTSPTVNFCNINEKVEATKQQMAVVLHEIGHVLGLKHEHQSPAFKGLLTWIAKEVKAYFKRKYKWTSAQTQAEVLDIEDPKYLTSYTHPDLKSIMMYPMPKRTNLFKGFGKKGVDLPENTSLSTYDKAFIGIHYPFLDGNPRSPEWTFQRALEEIGFGGPAMDRIMEMFHQRDWDKLRSQFEEIYASVRAQKIVEMESLQSASN